MSMWRFGGKEEKWRNGEMEKWRKTEKGEQKYANRL
jgi:hypothetical protein